MSTRERAELLIEARWLLPIAPANTALADHAVAVSAGRIVAIGPSAALRARFEIRERVVRERHALLPGLVNAHTRACHTLLRGLPVRGPRWRWLTETVAPVEERCVSADFVRDGTRLGIAEMLRGGITCFADLSLFPEEAARAAAAAHVRAAIGLPVSDAPTPWAEGATAHLARAERLWDEYRADSRIGLYFAPLTVHGVSEALLTRVRRVADELDARVAVHLAELTGAAESADAGAGVQDGARTPRYERPLRQLHALGLLRPGFTAIGAGSCEGADLELLARHGAGLIACPQADLRLGARSPVASLEGNRTGLGTDSPVAAGGLDLLAEARAGALHSGLAAGEVLRMATLGGATVLGLQAQIGSIEPGKAADLICIDLGALSGQPAAAIADAIVFGATRAQVSDVWTAGRLAVSGARLVVLDEEELAALPARWAQRVRMEAAA
ncbi:MAG TPA: amidohydrolase family protein [Steroidobacteraceae bacterium]|nr:amidohydrolase family protein [Steroidobacteraceae bacterium]